MIYVNYAGKQCKGCINNVWMKLSNYIQENCFKKGALTLWSTPEVLSRNYIEADV